jgi:hypothetical protein
MRLIVLLPWLKEGRQIHDHHHNQHYRIIKLKIFQDIIMTTIK